MLSKIAAFPFERQPLALEAFIRATKEGLRSRLDGEKVYRPEPLIEVFEEDRTYTHKPVGPEQFLLDPDYLGLPETEVYPGVLTEFVKMNSGQYTEVVLTGGIGVAKTTLALWTTAYQLYLLSAFRNPQMYFNLQQSDEILFIFQSLTATLAKSLNFDRFRSMLEHSRYFTAPQSKGGFPFDKSVESILKFPKRIIVKSVSGADTAAIGQNVFGGFLDEVNFMALTTDSKKSTDGGVYDQALSLYNTISRRRKSRFMRKGKVPGIFCIVSSKRYPGQFTDQKTEEAKTDPTIYIYDKRTWDVLPRERFSGDWFKVFIGDVTRKPRIVLRGEKFAKQDQHLVIDVPQEYKTEFENDMMNALRDIAGVSTLARHPYIIDNEAVAKCFGVVPSVLSRDQCDFVQTGLAIHPKRFTKTEYPRFIHIDLGITGDAAGIACGYCPGFKQTQVAENVFETLPIIRYDFTLRVTPPRGGEIQFHKIRDLIYKLRDQGLPVKWVTLDSFQSRDTLQILRAKGFVTGMVSVDTDNTPYDMLKSAFYQQRVLTPEHEHAELEIVSLEREIKKNKIDHPPNGSKDVADAMAGVAFGLTMRRETWLQHDMSMFELPQSLKEAVAKMDKKMKEGDGGPALQGVG